MVPRTEAWCKVCESTLRFPKTAVGTATSLSRPRSPYDLRTSSKRPKTKCPPHATRTHTSCQLAPHASCDTDFTSAILHRPRHRHPGMYGPRLSLVPFGCDVAGSHPQRARATQRPCSHHVTSGLGPPPRKRRRAHGEAPRPGLASDECGATAVGVLARGEARGGQQRERRQRLARRRAAEGQAARFLALGARSAVVTARRAVVAELEPQPRHVLLDATLGTAVALGHLRALGTARVLRTRGRDTRRGVEPRGDMLGTALTFRAAASLASSAASSANSCAS